MSTHISPRPAPPASVHNPATATVADFAIITVIWCIAAWIVNPIGEFPLESDWSYARSVEHLLLTGEFRPLGWASMTLATNVYWGALFCLPMGFSFTALRFSGLVASLLTLLGLYVLTRDMEQPRWIAMLVSMTVAFCTLFYAHSHTFQTDMLFAALSIWAIVLFARSRRGGSGLHETLGTLLCLAATLSRQFALCIPLAFFLTGVVNRIDRTALRVLRASAPFIVCSATYAIFTVWMNVTGREAKYFSLHTRFIAGTLAHLGDFIQNWASGVFAAVIYAGLFLLPLSIVVMWHAYLADSKRIARLAMFGAFVTTLGAAIHSARGASFLMPIWWGPILTKSGIGPLLLRDTYILKIDSVQSFSSIFWMAVTIASVAGTILLIALITNVVLSSLQRRHAIDVGASLLIATAGIYLAVSSCGIAHDCWFIPLIMFLAAALPASASYFSVSIARRSCIIGGVVVAFFALFSVATTRDYLEWNRIRWEALHTLMRDQRVSPERIDGGLEFNGWYLYQDAIDVEELSKRGAAGKSWWWVHDDEYLISFGPVAGYQTFREYSYYNWLPPHRQTLLVLRKEQP